MKERVLVTRAGSKQSLAVARSLSKSGFEVVAGGTSVFSQTFFSNHCTDWGTYTDPKDSEEQYIRDLLSMVEEHSIDIMIPIGAAGTVPVALHQERFENVRIPIDSYENIELAHDKEKTFEAARDLGVPIPTTYCPKDEDELRRIADDIAYPAVVKPRKTAASRGMYYVDSKTELLKKYDKKGRNGVSVDFTYPLIQEYVQGEIHDVCVLFQNGELKKALTQKRLRMFPKSGGGGVVNVTTERPDLVDLARELLEPLDWHGVAQIEFMDGPETNEPKLIEVNPKVWGTTELSIAAGIDFPQHLCELASGERVTGPTSDYEIGLHFIWYEGGLLGNLYQSDGLVEPLRDILAIKRGNCASNIESSDGLPHAFRLPQLGLLGAKRLVKP